MANMLPVRNDPTIWLQHVRAARITQLRNLLVKSGLISGLYESLNHRNRWIDVQDMIAVKRNERRRSWFYSTIDRFSGEHWFTKTERITGMISQHHASEHRCIEFLLKVGDNDSVVLTEPFDRNLAY